MKIDYNFIKQILLVMEENETHEILLGDLLQKTGVSSSSDIDMRIDAKMFDKFIGHIKIIADKNLIKCSAADYGYGHSININLKYRITAEGYEFLDVLKNDTVFNKIKEFAFDNALEIGKQLLMKIVSAQLGL